MTSAARWQQAGVRHAPQPCGALRPSVVVGQVYASGPGRVHRVREVGCGSESEELHVSKSNPLCLRLLQNPKMRPQQKFGGSTGSPAFTGRRDPAAGHPGADGPPKALPEAPGARRSRVSITDKPEMASRVSASLPHPKSSRGMR
jgi:hypothetical protein